MGAISMVNGRARVAFFGLAVLALALAGCVPPPVANPAAQATVARAQPTAAPAQPTAAPAPAAEAMVKLASNAEYGSFLVAENGMTLYLYTKDTKDVSNCYDQCAVNWPVLFTAGAPKAGDGVDASLLGTTTRKDGQKQVTYNGWPLYYWIKDTKVGDTTGQNVGGVWFLVSPKGEMIMEAEAPGETSAPAVKTVQVSIKDFSFGAPLTVAVGTTVQWMNADSAAHTVTDPGGAFDSGNMAQGAMFSFTFTTDGTFDYICTYHPNMKGQVIVTK